MEPIKMVEVTEDIESIKAGMKCARNIADAIYKVMEDGQVDFKDIKELPTLFMQVKALVEAVKGMKAEAQDLDSNELKEVLTEGLELLLYIAKMFGLEL